MSLEFENYRGWLKNVFDAYRSPEIFIIKKKKKRYKAKLHVKFDNNISCSFDARVRINGDRKDHIKLVDNNLISSLQVKIDGHINNITNFKLLIPETRNSDNEIFVTTFLKELGYFAPRSSYINMEINNHKFQYIFQEDFEKEFIENNNRTEGPILRGDERFLFGNYPHLNFSKLHNNKWIKLDDNKMKISIDAMSIHNKTLFYNLKLKKNSSENLIDYQPNSSYFNLNKKNSVFDTYLILMKILDTNANLTINDFRMYYDFISDNFIPIYNDGKSDILGLSKQLELSKFDNYEPLNIDYIENKILRIDKQILQKNLKDKNLSISFAEIDNVIEKILKRLEKIKNHKKIKNISSFSINQTYNEIKNEIIKKKLGYITFNDNDLSFNVCNEIGCEKKFIKKDKIYLVLNQRYKIGNINYIFLGNPKYYIDNIEVEKKWKKISIENGISFKVLDIKKLNFTFDEKRQKLSIQNFGTAILFEDINIGKFEIDINNNSKNKFDIITGCTTFKNINFLNTTIISSDSFCEDSINILNSNGVINTLKISNSFSDGLDIDFSNLKINKIDIKDSLNDCIDFSYGNYEIAHINVNKCGDKGLSVGEKSYVNIEKIDVDNSNIGIASKDSSLIKLKNLNIKKVKNCLAAYNKKKEFGSATILAHNFECKKYYQKTIKDKHSTIVINNEIRSK